MVGLFLKTEFDPTIQEEMKTQRLIKFLLFRGRTGTETQIQGFLHDESQQIVTTSHHPFSAF